MMYVFAKRDSMTKDCTHRRNVRVIAQTRYTRTVTRSTAANEAPENLDTFHAFAPCNAIEVNELALANFATKQTEFMTCCNFGVTSNQQLNEVHFVNNILKKNPTAAQCLKCEKRIRVGQNFNHN